MERGIEGGYQFLDAMIGVDACSMMNRAMEHFEILKVEEPAALAGDEQNGLAGVTIDLEFHVPSQIAAVVLKITYFHTVTSLCKIEKIKA